MHVTLPVWPILARAPLVVVAHAETRGGTLDRGMGHISRSRLVAAATVDHSWLLEMVQSRSTAVMLYGSYARGDSTPSSDIDLLQLSESGIGHDSVGRVSITTYSPAQLRSMCEVGSLFALHLVSEGVVLRDPSGMLGATLAAYQAPSSYAPLRGEVKLVAQVLDASDGEIAANPAGFARLALYLVRTAAILNHIESTGSPCFAIPELASSLRQPQLIEVFSGREDSESLNADRLRLARSHLEKLLGGTIHNSHGSVAAFAVNVEVDHPIAARLALRLLGGERELGYGDLLLDPLIPPP